jgi:hypothetical protein
MMSKGDILLSYKDMSEDKRRALDHWIAGSFVISSILAGGLLLMALAGSGFSVSPEGASAARLSAPTGLSDQGGLSAFELMSKASGQLPVRSEDEQAF